MFKLRKRLDQLKTKTLIEYLSVMPLSSLSLSDIIKSKVKDPNGEKLGIIEDIILDMKRGLVEYLVLSCTGLFGNEIRYFAIPMGMKLIDIKKKGEMIINTDKKSLGNAFGFNISDCPKLNVSINDSSIIELYNYLPQLKK